MYRASTDRQPVLRSFLLHCKNFLLQPGMRLHRILVRKLRGNFMRFAFPSKPLSVLLAAVLLVACVSSVPSIPQAADEVSPRTEKEIVDATWMDMNFQRELKSAVQCRDIGILVTTRGYAEGEDVSLTIGEKNGGKEHDVKLHAKVDADGKARVRWPAMGCVDHMPTPLIEQVTQRQKSEATDPAPGKTSRPVKNRVPVDYSSPATTPAEPPLSR